MRTIAPIRRPVAPAACGAVLLVLLAAPTGAPAQEPERFALSGESVSVYNLVGEVRVEPAAGASVVVEVRRGGGGADRLEIETGRIGGRQTLRVVYPDDRIVYPALGRSSTRMHVRADGTFGDDGGGSRRRVTIAGRGAGLEAYADLTVRVPAGRRIGIYLGAGRVDIANVEGDIVVDVANASIAAKGTRGRLLLDTGSGSVEVREAEGDVEIDTGSGRVDVQGIRGSRLYVDTGAGRVAGSGIEVDDLEVDTGSGSIRLSAVRSPRISLDTGSGGVDLGLLSAVRDLVIDTGSGAVTLSVPASIAAELEIDTGSGGIDVDLPLSIVERNRSYLLGRLGGGRGEGRIRIDTGSGGVRVRGT